VDFWAAWCGPCRVIGPLLEKLEGEAGGRWVLAKVDTEALTDVAARYGIQSIPAVKLFVKGEVVDEFVGALPEGEIRRWLDHAIPSPHAAVIADATKMISDGRFKEASAVVADVLRDEPANTEARLLLARSLVHTDPDAVAEALRPFEDDFERADVVEGVRTLGHLAGLPGRPDTLPPGPARDRFVAGATAVRKGDFAAAFDAFIEVLETDRAYADGAAKSACRAIIQVLGLDHPVVDTHFRAFSSAVNR
jgi:putative thioredoxin